MTGNWPVCFQNCQLGEVGNASKDAPRKRGERCNIEKEAAEKEASSNTLTQKNSKDDD